MAINVEEIADAMYAIVKEYAGRKQYTARELTKTVMQQFGSECDRNICKEALRQLIDSGRCIYTYKGSSYVELPQEEK